MLEYLEKAWLSSWLKTLPLPFASLNCIHAVNYVYAVQVVAKQYPPVKTFSTQLSKDNLILTLQSAVLGAGGSTVSPWRALPNFGGA